MTVNREDIRSMKFVTENQIEKSVFQDVVYDSTFKIEKTGAEIKEAIKQLIIENLLKNNELFNRLDDLVQSIGESPEVKLQDNELKGFRRRLQVIPMKYSHEKCYPNTESYSNPDNLRSKYNSLVWEFIDAAVDNIVLKKIFDGLKDDKGYKLNSVLAAKFGL